MLIWCEQLIHWKSPWCCDRLRAGEDGVRWWDGWMASPMQWTWTWANFGDSEVPGASVRNSTHGKCHEEGGSALCKGGIEPQETPCSWASTPKTRVCFMLSPTPLTLRGLSPITISLGEGVNLQLQLIKIPGRDKSVSTYKLLWRFSSLPERVRPATCDCLQPPNHERHEML